MTERLSDEAAKQTARIAENLLVEALRILRHLTPEGWDIAYYQAIGDGAHTVDLGLLKDARLLSMRRGGKWGVGR